MSIIERRHWEGFFVAIITQMAPSEWRDLRHRDRVMIFVIFSPRFFAFATYNIDENIVEDEKIQGYTPKNRPLSNTDFTETDVDYYLNPSGAQEQNTIPLDILVTSLQPNEEITEDEEPIWFPKEGKNPVTMLFNIYQFGKLEHFTPEESPKIIIFDNVEASVESSCPFIFNKSEKGACFRNSKVPQANNNIELIMPLKVEKNVDNTRTLNVVDSFANSRSRTCPAIDSAIKNGTSSFHSQPEIKRETEQTESASNSPNGNSESNKFHVPDESQLPKTTKGTSKNYDDSPVTITTSANLNPSFDGMDFDVKIESETVPTTSYVQEDNEQLSLKVTSSPATNLNAVLAERNVYPHYKNRSDFDSEPPQDLQGPPSRELPEVSNTASLPWTSGFLTSKKREAFNSQETELSHFATDVPVPEHHTKVDSSKEEGRSIKSFHRIESLGCREATVLRVESMVSNGGGFLQIEDTEVTLTIPPDALGRGEDHCLIQMRIIPPGSYDEVFTSFSSNSSAVVELLPNNLRFKRLLKLTLPHCLKLKKGMEPKARILMSHHEGEAEPRWEEVTNDYILDDRMCTIWLNRFCWTKYEIDDEIVEAKKIKLYTAAAPICVPDDIAEIEVGYHLDLPGAGEILQWNPSLIVGQRRPFLFLREGKHPLKVSLKQLLPRTWQYSTPEENPKEISFRNVAWSIEYSCPFILEHDTKTSTTPTCSFTASQNDNEIQLNIRPKKAEGHHQESAIPQVKEISQSVQSMSMTGSEGKVQSLQELRSSMGDPDSRAGMKATSAYMTIDNNEQPTPLRETQNQGNHQPEGYLQRNVVPYKGHQPPEVEKLLVKHYSYNQIFNMAPADGSISFGAMSVARQSYWHGNGDNESGHGLGFRTVSSIARKLDPTDPLGKDWRLLADELGFTMEDIAVFARAESPTILVIGCALQKKTLECPRQLSSILSKMDRKDAANCISD